MSSSLVGPIGPPAVREKLAQMPQGRGLKDCLVRLEMSDVTDVQIWVNIKFTVYVGITVA